MSATDDYAGGLFEKAKAKLLYEAGRFLQNRDRILRMIGTADLMGRKADATGDQDLATIAGRLRRKLDGLYSRQIEYEGQVQAAAAGMSQAGASGALALVQAALSLAPLLKDLARHVAGVKLAERATEELSKRTLTAADLASMGDSPGPTIGNVLAVGGVVAGVAFFVLRRARR